VIAYKFLQAGGLGPFSGFAWPQPGRWVGGRVSACRASDLPIWLHEELWVAELDGAVEEARTKLVAPRGRLLRQEKLVPHSSTRVRHAIGYASDAANAAMTGRL
jgi:hypothetical protein